MYHLLFRTIPIDPLQHSSSERLIIDRGYSTPSLADGIPQRLRLRLRGKRLVPCCMSKAKASSKSRLRMAGKKSPSVARPSKPCQPATDDLQLILFTTLSGLGWEGLKGNFLRKLPFSRQIYRPICEWRHHVSCACPCSLPLVERRNTKSPPSPQALHVRSAGKEIQEELTA